MKLPTRRSLLGGILASALLLTGLSGNGALAGDAPNLDPATTPAAGGTLRLVVPAEPRSLNQAIDNNSSAIGIGKLVNERLVWIDADRGQPEPGLVESWERVDDTTWVLELVEGIAFTNGEPFDADAAVFSILDVRDTPGAFSAYVQTIADAEATDEHTVTVTTNEPIGFLPAILTIVPAVPPLAYGETPPEEFGRAPIGTGPFVLDDWSAGQRMTFVRNEEYWGEPALLDSVELSWNGEAETRVALLETGEAEIIKTVPPQLVDRVENDDRLSIASTDGLGVLVLQPNMDAAPFDDVRVRRAVAHAIDRDALVNAVFSGVGASPYDSVFVDTFESGGTPDGAPTFDPEAASALVEEVGEIGPIELYWPNGRYVLDNQVGEALAGMLEDVGFTVDRKPMEAGAYFELLLTDEMPGIHLISMGAVFPHESYPLNSFFLPDSVVTYCAQEDLVDEATAALSLEGDERTEAYAEIARRLVVDDVCPIPMYVETHNWGVDDAVHGFVARGDEFLDLATVWVDG